jgi:hypothetical protein
MLLKIKIKLNHHLKIDKKIRLIGLFKSIYPLIIKKIANPKTK